MTARPEERKDGPHLAEQTVIAHYRIVEELGSGGMGNVYKAWDTKLNRHVALKVLRPHLVRDPEKLRRFTQEAKAASALNHSTIVTIYEVGSDRLDGEAVHYIAMEHIEGQSLRRRIGSMPLHEALLLLRSVAEGMAFAHAAGVVHRDLKPDNIMVTPAGQPKIVDFGLAKLTQPEMARGDEGRDDDTATIQKTRDGLVLGTVGYISPEQIDGRPVDQRCDVFSFGCILYEVVTRKRPFTGASAVETLHQILTADPPPLRRHAPSAPEDLERITDRCLAKDPERRYQSIKEVAIELDNVLHGKGTSHLRARRRWPAMVAAALALLLAAAVAAVLFIPQRPDIERYRFTPVATGPTYEGFPAWSPDGKSLVYAAEAGGVLQVFVRSLDSPVATQLTRAPRDCRDPFWDPSGEKIYYVSLAEDRDTLWSVGVGGGAPQKVFENVYTAAISPDGKTLAMLRDAGEPGTYSFTLWMSTPPGAAPKRYSADPFTNARFASGFLRFSPDNRKLALWVEVRGALAPNTEIGKSVGDRTFWLISLDGAKTVGFDLTRGAERTYKRPYPFSWMPDSRHIVFAASVNPEAGLHLWMADTSAGQSWALTNSSTNEHYPAVSPDGKRIVFCTEEGDFDIMSISLGDRSMRPFLVTTRSEKEPVWSPSLGAFAYVTNRSGPEQIWLRSQDGAWDRPIVTEKEFGEKTWTLTSLAFSPDGQRVAYWRDRRVWISPVAGGRPVMVVPGLWQDRPTWSPDGDSIAYIAIPPGGGFDLLKTRLGIDEKPVTLAKQIIYPSNPKWSPRGDWITVELPEGFAVISPDGAKRRVLSQESYLEHTWSRDGSIIYAVKFSNDLHLMLVTVSVDTGAETELADLGPSPPVLNPLQGLSLSADGKSLLTSMPRLKGDLWLLEGFDEPQGMIQRLGARLRR